MFKQLEPGARIGIIGAGQLGKMLAQSAQKMGYKVDMYDPNPTSCGFNVAHSTYVADFDNREQLLNFVKSVDVVTYEFENINGELLQELESVSYLPQGTKLLLNSQHRIKEKEWLNEINIPTADFREIKAYTDLHQAVEQLGLPAILKTTRFGYDGKGQLFIKDIDDVIQNKEYIEQLVENQSLILEAFYDFSFESSVIVARDVHGSVNVFPMSINHHIHGVLFSSLVGKVTSREFENLTIEIQQIAETIAKEGQLIGVCGIEFFISSEGVILVNEIAPRPHNSGHYTIEGCNVSQFDQHILAITGHQIIESRLLEPSLMVNILGQHLPLVEAMRSELPDALYHIYDKGEPKKQRKMGHFTLTNSSYDKLKELLEQSKSIQSWRTLF
ncbi:5-(carboxyamino)imidazole ribonucleotide synthase [Aerococcaceae bacterium WGS1372]